MNQLVPAGYLESLDDTAVEDLIGQYSDAEASVVKFYRVTKGEKDALLEEVAPSDFNFISLARRHGRGEYRIKLYVPNPEDGGRLTLRVNRPERYEGAVDTPTPVAPVATPGAQIDPATLGAAIAQAVVAGLAPVLQQQQAAPSRADFLKEIAAMKALFTPDTLPQQSGGVEAMLGLFMKGMEMGRDMNIPEDGLASFASLAKPLVGPLAEIAGDYAAKMRSNPAPPATPAQSATPALPSPKADNAEAVTQPKTPQEGEQMFGINRYTPFKQQIDYLVNVFKRNPHTDPTAYAVVVLDEMPPVAVDAILADPKLINNFIEVNPDVAHFRLQFEAMLAEMRAIVSGDDGSDETVLVTSKPGGLDTAPAGE